ncbi:hypothetical protein [Companilactobacillus metriopterae]|uniref:hypothetical protein n=1 Tax=Companilactobacillus metriopterae TaxID=1909267 RepID=UPI0013E995C3|nr:hypothetical protein [Companilactobacillus metriopterae]
MGLFNKKKKTTLGNTQNDFSKMTQAFKKDPAKLQKAQELFKDNKDLRKKSTKDTDKK